MPKFMIKASYTPEGARGLVKEGGTGRRATIQKLIESIGGKVEAFYFAYGEDDAYVITDVPDAARWTGREPGGERLGLCSAVDDPAHHARRNGCGVQEVGAVPRTRRIEIILPIITTSRASHAARYRPPDR